MHKSYRKFVWNKKKKNVFSIFIVINCIRVVYGRTKIEQSINNVLIPNIIIRILHRSYKMRNNFINVLVMNFLCVVTIFFILFVEGFGKRGANPFGLAFQFKLSSIVIQL